MFTLSKSLRAVAGALALATICAAPVLAADKTVLVTSIVEHPALDAVRDGTKDELKAEGFEAGKNLKVGIPERARQCRYGRTNCPQIRG